jgi:ABC-2 type transport system permease protein
MRLKYNLIQYFRDREILFYTLLFPVIMGILFFQAFNFADEERGEIPVAIVEQGPRTALNEAFLELVYSIEQREMLAPTFVGFDDAVEILDTGQAAVGMMDAGQVIGVIILGDTIELKLANAGVEQSLLDSIVNEFMIRSAVIENITELRPQYRDQAIAAIESYITVSAPVREIGVSPAASFFYVLLAMGCFTGSMRGLKNGFDLQAHVTNVVARLSVAPTKKFVLVIENLITAVIAQALSSTVLVLFYIFGLGIDFGTQWALIVVACVFGSFASVAFGMLVSVLGSASIETKSGYLTIVTYGFLFAAGILGIEFRNMIRATVPFLDRINLVAIISDTFLSLVLHENLNRFFQQLSILMGIAIVCSVAAAIVLRGKNYADI